MNTPSTFVQYARLQRQLAAAEEKLKTTQETRYGAAVYSKFVTSSTISVLPYLVTLVTLSLYRAQVAVDLTMCVEEWFGDGVMESVSSLGVVGRKVWEWLFFLLSLPSGRMGTVSVPVWCVMCNKVSHTHTHTHTHSQRVNLLLFISLFLFTIVDVFPFLL